MLQNPYPIIPHATKPLSHYKVIKYYHNVDHSKYNVTAWFVMLHKECKETGFVS